MPLHIPGLLTPVLYEPQSALMSVHNACKRRHVSRHGALAGVRLRGAKAVALMAQDSSLSAVDAILETHPALREKLSPADVSSLRVDEASSVQDSANIVHRVVTRAWNIVHCGRSSQRHPSVNIYFDILATHAQLAALGHKHVHRMQMLACMCTCCPSTTVAHVRVRLWLAATSPGALRRCELSSKIHCLTHKWPAERTTSGPAVLAHMQAHPCASATPMADAAFAMCPEATAWLTDFDVRLLRAQEQHSLREQDTLRAAHCCYGRVRTKIWQRIRADVQPLGEGALDERHVCLR
jgi:hypothetical protein